MKTHIPLAVGRLGFIAFVAVVPLLLGVNLATGQEAKEQAKDAKAKDAAAQDKAAQDKDLDFLGRKSSIVMSGYTRPGYPNDKVVDDKIVSVAWDFEYKGRIIGGTVYFSVFERSDLNPDGDRFGTGIVGFDDAFVEGRGASGRYSPAFGSSAKYLYVYQVVNDRGLDPQPILMAAQGNKLRTDDVFSFDLHLPCDPADITSWGYFRDTAFTAKVPDRGRTGDIVMAGLDGAEKKMKIAFSSDSSVLGALPYQQYTVKSPAYPLRDLRNDFGLGRSNLNLKNTKSYKDLDKLVENKIEVVAWQKNVFEAAKGGKNPTFVELTTAEPVAPVGAATGDATTTAADVRAAASRNIFRADFRGNSLLKPGYASVVFGFTSNLPPVHTVGKVFGEIERTAIKAVANEDAGGGIALAAAQAPGTVPAPAPAPAAAGGGFGGGGFWAGAAPVAPPTLGGGGGIGAGGIGTAPAPFVAGGTGGGTGSGTGNPGTGTATTGQQSGPQSQTINFSPVLTNKQSQHQFQQQQQQQKQQQQQQQQQHQTNNNHHHAVVPEPAAIGLAVLGVPVLVFLVRRRKSMKSLSEARS